MVHYVLSYFNFLFDPSDRWPDPPTGYKPTFDDSFVHVEIARAICKHAEACKDRTQYQDPQLEKSLSIAGQVKA